MDKNIQTLCELIEHSSEANKMLLANLIAMENGEVAEAQKQLKSATSLLKVMIGDIFEETKEVLSTKTEDEDDYDYSILDLSKLLAITTYNAGALINCYLNNDSDVVKNLLEKKLATSINAIESLSSAILLN